ncbi:hypothetical protein Q7P35_008033 [Cladosporium inversicolor]
MVPSQPPTTYLWLTLDIQVHGFVSSQCIIPIPATYWSIVDFKDTSLRRSMSSKPGPQDPIVAAPPAVHVTIETMQEDSATGYTHHFPEDLLSRPGRPAATSGWRRHLRSRFWTFSLSSYDIIHTHDGQKRIRHIIMITILLLRAAMSGLSILSAIIKKNVAGIIVYSLLALLSVWFTATCLAIIGDAAGDRRVTDFERRNAGVSMPFLDSVSSSTPYLSLFSSSSWADWV